MKGHIYNTNIESPFLALFIIIFFVWLFYTLIKKYK